MPERSSESGQDYAAVESILTVGSQLPLLGDRRNQPRKHFLEIKGPKSWEMHFLMFRFQTLSNTSCLRVHVSKNQTFSNFRGHSSKWILLKFCQDVAYCVSKCTV